MALTLQYTAQTELPVEIEGFTPGFAMGKTPGELAGFLAYHGNERLPLGDLFALSGDPADGQLVFAGDLRGVHWIGAGMASGAIRVEGSAGRHVGSEMTGGCIDVEGDAGDWVGAEMHDGLIRVRGSAGDSIGSAYRGSPRGMTGGTILIDGDVGDEVGHSMRRGFIAVGGSAGDHVAVNMLAGSILVFGPCGIRPGAGMRRGTIALLGEDPPGLLLPTFRRGCRFRPDFLKLYLRSLRGHGFAFDHALLDVELTLHHGDLLTIGKGEILVREM